MLETMLNWLKYRWRLFRAKNGRERLTLIAMQYFRAHPAQKRSIQTKIIASAERPHTWPSGIADRPDCRCVRCGAIKEHTECLPCPEWHDEPEPDIAGIIKAEEERYWSTLNRVRGLVQRKYSNPAELTGETLAMLHHTHGADPIMVEDILGVDLPQSLHDDYLAAYQHHKETGSKGFQPVEILAQ